MLRFRPEVLPFIAAAAIAGVLLTLIIRACGPKWCCASVWGLALFLIATLYFLYFFRDPDRHAPGDDNLIVSSGEGTLAAITPLTSDAFREHARRSGLDPDALGRLSHGDVTRISVFLSPFNVHVNRAPLNGKSRFLGYFPGKHIFTGNEKSSEENQHNSILIEHPRTTCLLNQIVGPVCRRVVYWLPHDRTVDVRQGDRIGMMKFGSRLDLYFPSADIEATITVGDPVKAGETVVARLRGSGGA